MIKNTIYVFKTIERNRNRIDYSFYDSYEKVHKAKEKKSKML